MRHLAMDVFDAALPLAERFTIARQSWEVARSVFVTLLWRDGSREIVGLGEGQPAERWGESVESVTKQLAGAELDSLSGPFDLEGVTKVLPAGAARAALDVAMHDLAAKLAGLSVAELLGVSTVDPPPTSVTLPIDSVEAIIERAEAHADHPVLKMKVGFDGDVDAVAAVREVFHGRLRVDANEGWHVDDATTRLRALERFDIELCEQPIPAGDIDALRRVAQSTSIPVFADEDACTSHDVMRLHGAVHGVNLKLSKSGGLREMVRAVAVARAARMQVMIGCNLETGVATTAGASVAALADHVDLDAPLLLARDPYPGVTYSKGKLTLPDGPGLGVKEVAT